MHSTSRPPRSDPMKSSLRTLLDSEEFFYPLQVLLQDWSVENLVVLPTRHRESIIQYLPEQQKLAMAVLFARIDDLAPRVSATLLQASASTTDIAPVEMVVDEKEDAAEPWIDFKRVCAGDSLSSVLQNSASVFVVSELPARLAKKLADVPLQSSAVFSLDLSCNVLFAEDMGKVYTAVQNTACKTLDLSKNRIFASTQAEFDKLSIALIGILELKQLRFCDITINPIASIDSQDFFVQLADKQLEKLIFIPEHWLSAGHWKVMLQFDPDRCAMVMKRHTAYYRYRAQAHYKQVK